MNLAVLLCSIFFLSKGVDLTIFYKLIIIKYQPFLYYFFDPLLLIFLPIYFSLFIHSINFLFVNQLSVKDIHDNFS